MTVPLSISLAGIEALPSIMIFPTRVSLRDHRKLEIFGELRCNRNSTRSYSLRFTALKRTNSLHGFLPSFIPKSQCMSTLPLSYISPGLVSCPMRFTLEASPSKLFLYFLSNFCLLHLLRRILQEGTAIPTPDQIAPISLQSCLQNCQVYSISFYGILLCLFGESFTICF
jgi:hypothetical protein